MRNPWASLFFLGHTPLVLRQGKASLPSKLWVGGLTRVTFNFVGS